MTKPTIERTLLLLRHAKAEQAPGKRRASRITIASWHPEDARTPVPSASGCVTRRTQEGSHRALST